MSQPCTEPIALPAPPIVSSSPKRSRPDAATTAAAPSTADTASSPKRVAASVHAGWTVPPCVRTKPFVVIGVSGCQGSGKNYLTERCLAPWLLDQRLWTVSLAYANQLKIDAQLLYGLSFESVFITKDAKARPILQNHGMERRQNVSPTYWIDQLHHQVLIHVYNGANVVLITDNRYVNEFEYVKSTFPANSLLIRIEAPQRVQRKLQTDYRVYRDDGTTLDAERTQALVDQIANHPSETEALQYRAWDLILDNDLERENESSMELMKFVQRQEVFRGVVRRVGEERASGGGGERSERGGE